jgi:hypothetical protein
MDLSWLISSGGGISLFDPYSLYHFVFFIAITTVLYPIFRKQVWGAVLALTFIWEVFEEWVVTNITSFPYAGPELFINKCIGDPISNLLGFLVAIFVIKMIRKIEHERLKKTGLEKDG